MANDGEERAAPGVETVRWGVQLYRAWCWILRHPWIPVAIIVAGLGLETFFEVTERVFYEPGHGVDAAIQTAVIANRDPWLNGMAVVLNYALYFPYVLVLLAPAAGIAFKYGRMMLGWAMFLMPFFTVVTVSLLKIIFGRARPSGQLGLVAVTGQSFPSGHATLSVVVYGMIAYTLLSCWARQAWQRVLVVWAALLLTLATGLSRVYLGVHYPSDVAAGWAVGVVILFGTIALLEIVRIQQQA